MNKKSVQERERAREREWEWKTDAGTEGSTHWSDRSTKAWGPVRGGRAFSVDDRSRARETGCRANPNMSYRTLSAQYSTWGSRCRCRVRFKTTSLLFILRFYDQSLAHYYQFIKKIFFMPTQSKDTKQTKYQVSIFLAKIWATGKKRFFPRS